jgi:hypothetical protein
MDKLPIEILKRAKTAFIIWIFLTLTCAFFGLLPFISTVSPGPETPSAEALQQMIIMFTALATIMAASSLFLRFYVLSEGRLKLFVSRLGLSTVDQTEFRTKALAKLAPQWLMFNILSWGLNESIASLGLMVSTATRNANAIIPFVGASLILNFIMRPDLEGTARKAGLI